MKKRDFIKLAGSLSAAMLAGNLAWAQTGKAWPASPVKIVVPFPAGGTTDVLGRILAEGLGRHFGQPFIVDNKPGAATILGAEAVARAPGDGYSLLLATPATLVTNRFTFKKLLYNPDAYEKIALVAVTPNLLVTSSSSPFKTLPELVAYARANPGKLTYASQGAGTLSHLAGEMLKSIARIDILHIPYKGAATGLPAVMSGEVSMYFDTITTSLPLIADGKLRALGVTSAQRSKIAPQVPTIAEQGYAGYDLAPWYALLSSPGTPAPVVKLLSDAMDKLMKDEAFQNKLAQLGAEPGQAGAKAVETMVRTELPKTEKLVKQAGLTMQ
ncbi:Bug family tripartite tricarboxylate transporter substrate binding protein [Ottowia thiooxydans]|uniref:Bug family tripartite tricarboxylate transporter substrate binding protein n=1 Tax=Ottowia thiooxydans TaxID=219182 RepID=UPI0003FCB375|nr:tripartite tricarboxylate transporter substrate binding protein [Ottowia thiooxydans]